MAAYYNENDKQAAQWLRNLIAAGLIAPGDVDDRSILDVSPDDLRGYRQCHFFAGVGVWSYALRQAGWPDGQPVWTGSCPCQPFSSAGPQAGFADERHLWPAFFHLIEECRPPVVFGEQVASKAAEPWIDLVQADLEGVGYSFGCVPFPSAGVGAPHIRDRAFWVGHSDDERLERYAGDDRSTRRQGPGGPVAPAGVSGGEANSDGHGREKVSESKLYDEKSDPESRGGFSGRGAGPVNGFWRDADWLLCRDGRWRPVRPGTFPLADGAASRVVRLRAYGNAINAEAATEFVQAYLESRGDLVGSGPDLI